MTDMRKFATLKNIEPFNDSLIRHGVGDLISYCLSVCSGFDDIKAVKFLKSKAYIIENPAIFKTQEETQNIDDSFVVELILPFRLTKASEEEGGNDEIQDIECRVFIPVLDENGFYKVKGVRYAPIHKIIDGVIYVDNMTISIRPPLMPIRHQHKIVNMTNINDSSEKIQGRAFLLELFGQKIPCMYYYFARFGFEEGLRWFDLDHRGIALYTKKNLPKLDSEWFVMNVPRTKNNKVLAVHRWNLQTEFQRNMIATMIPIMQDVNTLQEIDWHHTLGKRYTNSVNSIKRKADSVLFSFERIINDYAREITLGPLVSSPEEAENIYAANVWLLRNFENIRRKYYDSYDVTLKRVEGTPALAYPLTHYISKVVFRISNMATRKTRNSGMSTIVRAIKIKPSIILHNMVGHGSHNLRYDSSVNPVGLFRGLKATNSRGTKSRIAAKQRNIHPSMIGTLCLVSTGAQDPGSTTTFVPWANVDENGNIYEPKGISFK